MNNKLTILDIADKVSEKSGITKKESEFFVKEFFALASEIISKGESLTIKGVGEFAPVWVDARLSVDVNTKEQIEIPGHYKLSFIPDKSMKDAVNAPFSAFTTELVNTDADADISEEDKKEIVEQLDEPQTKSSADSTPIISEETESAKEIVEALESEEQKEEVGQKVEQPLQSNADQQTLATKSALQTQTYTEWELENEYRRRTRNGYIGGFITAVVIFIILLLFLWWLFNKKGTDFSISFSSFKLVAGNEQVLSTNNADETNAGVENKVDTLLVSTEKEITDSNVQKTATKEPVIETIQRGKFLTTIANKHYGNKIFWVYIYRENQKNIWNPRDLPVGFKVVVPDAAKYGIDASNPESVAKAKALEEQILFEIE